MPDPLTIGTLNVTDSAAIGGCPLVAGTESTVCGTSEMLGMVECRNGLGATAGTSAWGLLVSGGSSGGIYSNSSVQAAGNITSDTGNLTIAGTSQLMGSVGMGGASSPTHALKTYSRVEVGGDLGILGNMSQPTVGAVAFLRHVRVAEDLVVSGSSEVVGQSQLTGDVGMGGPIEAGYDLKVHGATRFVGNSRINGNNSVDGTSTLTGDVGVGGAPVVGTDLTVYGQSTHRECGDRHRA